MAKGTVAWFNSGKGYGFLSPTDDAGLMTGGKDIFCHFSDILMDGYKTLTQGDCVEFETEERDGRTVATKVSVVEKAVGHGR